MANNCRHFYNIASSRWEIVVKSCAAQNPAVGFIDVIKIKLPDPPLHKKASYLVDSVQSRPLSLNPSPSSASVNVLTWPIVAKLAWRP